MLSEGRHLPHLLLVILLEFGQLLSQCVLLLLKVLDLGLVALPERGVVSGCD